MFSACGELHTAVDESGCLPWTHCPNSISPCQCGSGGTIECNITAGVLSLQACFCVTYNYVINESIVENCLYSCISHLGKQVYELPMTHTHAHTHAHT